MNKQDAVQLLKNRWKDLEPSYGTITQWMKENQVTQYSLESIAKVLLRDREPSFELAIKLADMMGMSKGQLQLIAVCYEQPLFADLLADSDIPRPEAELAKRVMNLAPKSRKLVFDLLEVLEG